MLISLKYRVQCSYNAFRCSDSFRVGSFRFIWHPSIVQVIYHHIHRINGRWAHSTIPLYLSYVYVVLGMGCWISTDLLHNTCSPVLQVFVDNLPKVWSCTRPCLIDKYSILTLICLRKGIFTIYYLARRIHPNIFPICGSLSFYTCPA